MTTTWAKCNNRKVHPGMTFGRWTVLDTRPRRKGTGTNYHCQCVCGRKQWVSGSNLLSGATQSCFKCGQRKAQESRSRNLDCEWDDTVAQHDHLIGWTRKNGHRRYIRRCSECDGESLTSSPDHPICRVCAVKLRNTELYQGKSRRDWANELGITLGAMKDRVARHGWARAIEMGTKSECRRASHKRLRGPRCPTMRALWSLMPGDVFRFPESTPYQRASASIYRVRKELENEGLALVFRALPDDRYYVVCFDPNDAIEIPEDEK